MARICCNCGKKIGAFSNDPLTLKNDQFLCYECAEPIIDKVRYLYHTRSSQEFVETVEFLTDKIRKNYNDITFQSSKALFDMIADNRSFDDVVLNEAKRKNLVLKNHLLTTGYDFSGYRIIQYCGVISGQVVLGTGFLSEFSVAFADFFGDESNRFAEKLETAKNAAVEKLILKSDEKGGNAIIGVDFDYITFSNNMIGVVANGTSVVIEKEQ